MSNKGLYSVDEGGEESNKIPIVHEFRELVVGSPSHENTLTQQMFELPLCAPHVTCHELRQL